jgi:hypothetical protein
MSGDVFVREVARRRARAAVVSAALANCVPLVCAAIGRRPGTAWALRHFLVYLTLGTGVVGGLAAVVLATTPLLLPDGPRLARAVALLAGFFAIPLSFICMIVAAGPTR